MATQSDNTNTGVVATIVVVGAFSMIAISALLYALVRSEETELDAVRPIHADLDTIASLDRQQQAALNAPAHWVDKEKGKVGVPIERAMKLVLDEYRKDPTAASPPIPPGLVLPPVPGSEGAGGAGAVPAGAAPAGAVPAAHGGAPAVGGTPAPAPAATTGAPGSAAPPAAAPSAVPSAPKPAVAPSAPKPVASPSSGGAPATGAAAPAPAQPKAAAAPASPAPAAPAPGK